MYVPPAFAETDQETLHQFIQEHSFATLVSSDGGAPCGSHLPLLLDRKAGARGTLIGHMARANGQWRQAQGRQVLAIFHGPQAYISAACYGVKNSVPTWNYVAVHASGTFHLRSDPTEVREILQKYVAFYEAPSPQAWSLERPDAEFVDRLLDGIVGFEIPIDHIEGQWKLNQNHDRTRRQRVVDALRARGGDDEMQIAELMSKTLP